MLNQVALALQPQRRLLRAEYVRGILEEEMGRLTRLGEEVLEKLKEQDLIVRNINEEYNENLTIGQRMADR
ncbi:MAG: hypothetical protein ABIM88_07085, partial [candidate division WOR-3 bacterium]